MPGAGGGGAAADAAAGNPATSPRAVSEAASPVASRHIHGAGHADAADDFARLPFEIVCTIVLPYVPDGNQRSAGTTSAGLFPVPDRRHHLSPERASPPAWRRRLASGRRITIIQHSYAKV